MVAAPATADAVLRARRTPTLRVGLHVVLVNGRPALPAQRVPLLVDGNGMFETNLLRAGLRYFFVPGIRTQLAAEIRAQFEAFAAAGLPLDHVNAQNHLHLHPTVLSLILEIGRGYGVRAIRVPREPFLASYHAMGTHAIPRLANWAFLLPWLSLMRLRLRLHGIVSNDYVFGMNDTGHMTPETVRRFIAHLPPGISEIYLHPATRTWPGAFPADYDFAGEFAALIDPSVVREVSARGLCPGGFSELVTYAA